MERESFSRCIIELYEKLSTWEDAAVKGSGLSTAQSHALEIIGLSETIQMKQLAAKIGVTTGTLTSTVDRLEQKKLVQRVPHSTDRRSYLIQLTEQGQKSFAQHHAKHRQLTQKILLNLQDEEAEQFFTIAQKVIGSIESELASGLKHE